MLALQAIDRGDAKKALALSSEATAREPELAFAHHVRGEALWQLGRDDDAEQALRRAVELDPDDAESLLGLGEFLIHARTDPEALKEGLELAGAARESAESEDEDELAAEARFVEAKAQLGLGANEAALESILLGEEQLGDRDDVLLEKGSALFELGQVDAARAVGERLVARNAKDAAAHHLLGYVFERLRQEDEAESHFARARKIDPEGYPPPVALDAAQFDAAVAEAVAALPDDIRQHVSTALVSVKPLPDDADLREHESDRPLSPSMLGLFRGRSLRDPAGSGDLPPSIFLFQKNLERAAKTREELVEQIRVTVLHEVGHLLGLDEDDLDARGLH